MPRPVAGTIRAGGGEETTDGGSDQEASDGGGNVGTTGGAGGRQEGTSLGGDGAAVTTGGDGVGQEGTSLGGDGAAVTTGGDGGRREGTSLGRESAAVTMGGDGGRQEGTSLGHEGAAVTTGGAGGRREGTSFGRENAGVTMGAAGVAATTVGDGAAGTTVGDGASGRRGGGNSGGDGPTGGARGGGAGARGRTLLFGVAAGVSSLLLFSVEPLVAKSALPWFGGGPAVWTGCLVYFQTLLLVAYAVAHLATTRLSPRAQVALAALLVLASLSGLPPLVASRFAPPPGAWPLPSLLLALAVATAGPFLALAASTTLVQRSYARVTGRDPFPLYAASNAAALLGLLGYPLLVEPRLGLRAQGAAFSVAYVGFGLLFVGCLLVGSGAAPRARRSSTRGASAPDATEDATVDATADRTPDAMRDATPALTRDATPDATGSSGGAPSTARVASWVARAAAASLLLVAVSLRVATDIAAVPLLWTVPLALYLLTFVLAFLPRAPFPRRALERATALSLVFAMRPLPSVRGLLALELLPPLAALFLGALLAHGDLAKSRPAPRHLGAFYLALAVGGCLGGLASTLVAPLLFDSVAEYPIALVGVALVVVLGRDGGTAALVRALRRPASYALPAAMALVLALLALHLHHLHAPLHPSVGAPSAALAGARPGTTLAWAVPLLVLLAGAALHRAPLALVAACALVAALDTAGLGASARLREARRDFHGVLRVVDDGDRRALLHGTTVHGLERLLPDGAAPSTAAAPPTGYYHPAAPLPDVLRRQRDGARLAVVGLGTGTLAAYTRPGQRLTFYEIDPAVEPLARRWFHFLAASPATVEVVLGDARLLLAAAPPAALDLLVVDAFASDAIPIHLLTVEALALDVARLAPGGMLVVHISNRYLDLAPVLRGVARRLGLAAMIRRYRPDEAARREGAFPSVSVALAPDAATIAPLATTGWRPLTEAGASPADARVVDWTDDRSSLLDVLGAPPR